MNKLPPLSSCFADESIGLERPGSVSLESNQQPISSRVNVVATNRFQAFSTHRAHGLPLSVNLNNLLDIFRKNRINNNKVFEVRVSIAILKIVCIENFGIIVNFLKCQLQEASRKPINNTILLGLASFAWKTIANNKLYESEMLSKTVDWDVNLLTVFEFFKNNKELFPKLIIKFGFGVEPRYIPLNFIPFFNDSFSDFVRQLVINTDDNFLPQVLHQLNPCPKLKTIDLILKTGFHALRFNCIIHLIGNLVKESLMHFKDVDKFPNLSAIEMRIGINFAEVPFEQEAYLLEDIQKGLDSHFLRNHIQLPFTINNSSIFIYLFSYR